MGEVCILSPNDGDDPSSPAEWFNSWLWGRSTSFGRRQEGKSIYGSRCNV